MGYNTKLCTDRIEWGRVNNLDTLLYMKNLSLINIIIIIIITSTSELQASTAIVNQLRGQ